MTTPAPPSAAEVFVGRLLAAKTATRRRLIAAPGLAPAALHEALVLLDEEAVRLHGVDPRRMEQVCLDALALASAAGDELMQAMARMHQADALRGQGRNAESLEIYDEAAGVFKRLNRPVEAARTRIGWIPAAAALGRYTEALVATRRARRILAAHGETLRVAGLNLVNGTIYYQQGKYRQAIAWYTRALSAYASMQDADARNSTLGMAWCHANLGYVLALVGQQREAEEELKTARATFIGLGETVSAARVTRSFGQNQMRVGHYSAALRSFQEALATFRSLGIHSEALDVAYTMADCYLLMNRPQDTLVILTDVQDTVDGTPDSLESIGGITTRTVAALLQLDRRSEALAVIDEAERIAAAGSLDHLGWLAIQRATVLLRDGTPMEALVAAQRARNAARRTGSRRLTADASLIEGLALLQGGAVDEADRVAVKARQVAMATDVPPLLHRAHELLGRVAEARHQPASARRHYGEAIRHLEREQRGVIFEFRDSFSTNRGIAYERLAQLQVAARCPAEALITVERAKSRALTEAIIGVIDLRPRGSATVRRLTRDLAAAREQYALACSHPVKGPGGATASSPDDEAGGSRLAAIEARIAGLIRQLQLAGDAGDVADVHGALPIESIPSPPDGTVLVEFFLTGDDVLRFIVDRSGVAATLLPGTVPEIERLLRLFRLNLDATAGATPEARGRSAGQARLVLGRLYQWLLGGIDALAGAHSLVIVPHGLLHYLPFHALHDGEHYLVERYPVSYAPSAAVYAICRDRADGPFRRGRALVLAHSANGRLPFVGAESAAVAAVLGVPVHQEAAATRAALEAEGRRARVIHIAAHGRFRADAPLFSSIELADGPLTTADVFNLDLRAELVTLSACETGRAVVGGGDELAGLSRAFLYAGAAALLVSQWRVDDAATTDLMTRLYRELAHGASAAAALRTAQIDAISSGMRENGRDHPFFWAGFQVVGVDRGPR